MYIPRILIASRDTKNARLLCDMLLNMGKNFEIVPMFTYEDALFELTHAKCPPWLVVVDLSIGRELVDWMARYQPGLPVIMTSGGVCPEVRLHLPNNFAFLTNPCHIDRMRQLVAAFLIEPKA